MPSRGPHRTLFAVLLVLCASLLLAACGDEENNPELLPERLGNSMVDDLEEAEAAFADGDCDKVYRRLEKVLAQINALGSPPIDKELKLRLREGVNELLAAADEECGPEPEPAPAPEPEPEPAPAPAPAPEPETPDDEGDSDDGDDDENVPPDETSPDEPQQPEPEPTPPEPEPTPDPEPAPNPTPPPSPGGSGGVGPGAEVGGS